MEKFYDTTRDMCCIAGDTLPTFLIETDAKSLTGCSMVLILADEATPDAAVLRKACTVSGTSFTVQLTGEDTAALNGIYNIIFSMTDSTGSTQRKLAGKLLVLAAPTEVPL